MQLEVAVRTEELAAEAPAVASPAPDELAAAMLSAVRAVENLALHQKVVH